MRNILDFFKDNPPKDLKSLLDKMDLPSVCHTIMKILITKGNPTLISKGATDEKLNDLSREKVQPTTLLQEGSNRIYLSYYPQGFVVLQVVATS